MNTITIALIGNPNTGKSTLFTSLTGAHQRTGNYPGVTVEKKIGTTTVDGHPIRVIDLPGTYSLSPRSPDEMVSVDVLLGRQSGEAPPEVIVCVLDASNLERNLFLLSQVQDLGIPVIAALNMIDLARQKEIEIDVERLSELLKIKVVATQAHRGQGVAELRSTIVKLAGQPAPTTTSPLPAVVAQAVDALKTTLDTHTESETPRFLVERLLLDTSGFLESRLVAASNETHSAVEAKRKELEDAGVSIASVEALSRYARIGEIARKVVKRPATRPANFSDKLDRVLTHKVIGTLIFAALMMLVFQAVFSWSGVFMDAIDAGFGALGDAISGLLPSGPLRSLIVDGVIAGVGGVLIFLPQIMILFIFIAILEDCGYMARAAYLMDKLMSRIGLSGKSFIPLLSSFACAIPGIMATRVIENRKDRLITILVAPLMSCSARLPVYTVLIAAFIPATPLLGGLLGLQSVTMFAMYCVGAVMAIVVAFVLKKTIMQGETPPFIMELPSFKIPSLRVVAMRVVERGWSFVRRAGTMILAVSILVWAAAYFPRNGELADEYQTQIAALESQRAELAEGSNPQISTLDDQITELESELAGKQIRSSFLGRAGKLIEPAVRPLGWDWRIGCAAIASFPAREVIIATLGVIYDLGSGEDESSDSLKDAMQNATWDGTDRKVYNIPVALSIMVFFALCAQCAATLVIIKRETNSWRWPIFSFVYMTTLAYFGALLTYQIGTLFI